MWFWIFMLCMNMLTPAMMLIFGIIFTKNPPEKMNYGYGYRSKRSMKTQETWTFAQVYMGKVWKKAGLYMTIVSLPVSIALFPLDKDGIGNVSLIIITVQMVVLLGSIYLVEKALKQNFDKDGKRKDCKPC